MTNFDNGNQMEHTQFLMNLSILIVDDDDVQLQLLKEFISLHGGHGYTARKISKALELVETHQFDVTICNLYLNGDGSGIDLIDHLKKIDSDLTAVLITRGEINEIVQNIISRDIYAVIQKPLEMNQLGLLLFQAARNTKNFRQNRFVASNLKNKIDKIQFEHNNIFINTLLSLSNALEQKDEYTKNHSEVVSNISEKICWDYSDNKQFINEVIIAGKLHDIGKIGIKDSILFKNDSLDNDEYNIIKQHPEMSYKIIKPVDGPGKISAFVLHHHERWDGNGYPHKLKEKGIPVGSRILSVADTFNALTSNRPYRKAKDIDQTMEIMFEGINSQFDSEIVEILYRLIKSKRITIS